MDRPTRLLQLGAQLASGPQVISDLLSGQAIRSFRDDQNHRPQPDQGLSNRFDSKRIMSAKYRLIIATRNTHWAYWNTVEGWEPYITRGDTDFLTRMWKSSG